MLVHITNKEKSGGLHKPTSFFQSFCGNYAKFSVFNVMSAEEPLTNNLPPMNTGNYFLDSLPLSVMQRMTFQLETVRLAKGRHLYRRGGNVDSIYFPLSAVVSKYGISEEGRSIELALAGSEGVVGLASTFNQCAAMQCCQVTISGTAMKIRTEFVVQIVRHEPGLRNAVMRSLDDRLRQMSRRVLCNRYHTVEQRLCTWMLMVSERCGRPSIRITHNDAARALGVHRPTITEAMANLCEQGIIGQSTGRIEIVDEHAVRGLACECLAEYSTGFSAGKNETVSLNAA
jgi:CRP-like cAMP-binding protein